ncbi:glycerophosphoryl diester phosphodiesterase membrane domain-containing protein [Methanococcoides seepicolus]|uniref:Glycerophosphoryl diester phosphodiesterase membrane domain-containing protein n=1 Tax=Methanococcoides seepicolus TaxID=2828780 RepID=A0A9E4ZEG3_9EURY|nr:glycerophosphoryl diester phosphodiesterase membrane domain-containing protein [Methanococcoides seepicolus]MCM1986388.1 glycerophosphoryl diester phosphodiesterase membrane domain-containing protein [Methanococcoides seepicolus]
MDYEDIFSRSWNAFKDNVAAFIVATIIVVFGSIFIVTIAPLFYGLTYMAVKGLRGEKVEINDVFEGFNRFVKSWVLLLVSVILIGIGYMLLILPGLILSILLIYSFPLLVIKDYGAMDAIKESIDISKQNFVDSLVLFIIVAIISAIGGITYIVSLVTIPIITLALVAATVSYVGTEGNYTAEYTDVSDQDDENQ